MIRLTSVRRSEQRWKSLVALLGVAVILVGGFFMIHCSSHHGGMDPDLCAMTVVSLAVVMLVGPLMSGRLGADVVPALVLVTLAPPALPPETRHS